MSEVADTSSNHAPATVAGPLSSRQVVGGIVDRPAVQLGVFGATLFVSALLLFTVQPMFAKMALPKLGGAPSVWAVSMCFFQTALLGGYLYAHLLNKAVAPRLGVFVHLTFLVVTLFALPIGLPALLGEPPQGDAYLWLIGVLGLGVGLPFFAVSANAPLLQAWFSRTGHAQARDPYFLYGASNVGSLLALLAYPTLIEPLVGAQAQARLWSFGFIALGVLIAASGALMIWLMPAEPQAEASGAQGIAMPDAFVAAPANADRGLWMLLAAIPSGLMVAVTTFVTTDIASAPFLWVIPLALFLATFILVFKDTVGGWFEIAARALPFLAVGLTAVIFPGPRMALSMVAFFVAALVCHRQLYLSRPPAHHLTEFYLWMSAGGMLGGVFAALVAPQIFTSVFEFQVLMAATLFCIPGVLFATNEARDWRRIAGLACLATSALIASFVAGDIWGYRGHVTGIIVLVVGIMATLWLTRTWPEQRVAFVIGLAAVIVGMPESLQSVYAERSFFGTVRIVETGDKKHRLMLHGTTMHGVRRLADDKGPIANAQPAAYYHPAGAMARGFDVARRAKAVATNKASTEEARLITGIVGLGTGSLACYARPGDAYRYYEIDPVVVKVARDQRFFDFLARCTPSAPIILGDARLTLAKEPDEAFDYLVIDAFSSDSVPVHLLTVEALQLYLSKLSDTGVLALHISNRHMDLPSAVSATLAEVRGVSSAIVRFAPDQKARPEEEDASSSVVVFVARNPRVLEPVMNWPDADGLPRTSVAAWTDDFSDVLTAVVRKWWN